MGIWSLNGCFGDSRVLNKAKGTNIYQAKSTYKSNHLQIASKSLISLNGFKQALKVTSTKASMIVTLNNFDEECRTILKRSSKYLQ